MPQYDKDKIAAYHKYKFDASFVGDDQKGSELFSKMRRRTQEIWLNCSLLSYTLEVSSTKLREKLQLPANWAVVEIEKTESEKKQGLFARLASSFKSLIA